MTHDEFRQDEFPQVEPRHGEAIPGEATADLGVGCPDREQILSRFGAWLDQTQAEVAAFVASDADDDPHSQPVGMLPLVEQFTALRHEIKLLTKASRGTEERTESTLLSMQAAIEQFRSVPLQEAQAAESAARPLVAALLDLDESLQRGRSVIENARRRVMEDLAHELAERQQRFEQMYRAQPWWRRLLCRPWHAAATEMFSEKMLADHRTVFDSLLEGYDLIQVRCQRTMDAQSIVRMACAGRQVDPNSMTVLETISDPARPPGLVVEQVRPGYYWKGQVFRFAEVRVVGEH